jgi:hypothetical protein
VAVVAPSRQVFLPTSIFIPLPNVNSIPLFTARIQNPNQNGLYKR